VTSPRKTLFAAACSTFARAAIPLAAVACALTVQPAAAAVSSDWTGTATHAFDAHGLTAKGSLSSSATVSIVVSLKLNNQDELKSFISATHKAGSPAFGARLSSDTVVSRYSPTVAQAKAVTDYLKANGFTNIVVDSNRLLVSADGTPATIRAAFNTELKQYSVDGRLAFANSSPAQVPSRLSGIVNAVVGLDTVSQFHTMLQKADVSPNASGGFIPTAFPKAYGVGTMTTAAHSLVAITSWGNLDSAITDLRSFESKYSLPQVPVTMTYVPSKPTLTYGYTAEWDLDSQDIQGMTGGLAGIYGYSSKNNGSTNLLSTLNKVVTDNIAPNIDDSWGGCESSNYSSGFMASADAIFQTATAQGQTFFFSTGDSGSNECGTGSPTVSYPSSSPWVVAVGGTSLYVDGSGNYSSESVWSGEGGGISAYETAQSWQTQYLGSGTMRSQPDIVMDADPNTGAIIVVSGKNSQYGGTSLSAPLATAVWARYSSAFGSTGFAAPNLYYILDFGTLPYVPYHDVTTGNNGAYSAGTGWDTATGLGSFQIGNWYNDLLWLFGG